MPAARARGPHALPLSAPQRARAKFLHQFPGGFHDATYLDWERDYKVESHRRWQDALGPREMRRLLDAGAHAEIGARAVRVEQRSRHPMLFSFEKMALRDAIKSKDGARTFAEALHEWLHGARDFDAWVDALASLPRRQTRVLTWPLATVFGFLAQPRTHLFVKPKTMRRAAEAYGFELRYASRPSAEVYDQFLALARQVKHDLADLKPRDMIDAQSFLWVQGSDEY